MHFAERIGGSTLVIMEEAVADKNRLQVVAQETDRILAARCYVNSRGSRVDLSLMLDAQRAGTIL